MSFKKEKTILRICGILLILSSIIPIGIGIFFTYGKDFIAEKILFKTDPEIITRMVSGGLQTFLTGFIALFEGIFTLIAAKKDKFAKYAWALSIFGLTASTYNFFDYIRENVLNLGAIADYVVSVLISGTICLCALKIRNAFIENNSLNRSIDE